MTIKNTLNEAIKLLESNKEIMLINIAKSSGSSPRTSDAMMIAYFDENNNLMASAMVVPEELPENADPVFAAFYNYYAKRAYHPRAINFVTSWTATMPVSFWNFPLMSNIKDVSPTPILLVAGENAHSRYYSEDVYKEALEPKELLIIEDADHVDLYDNMEKIPFEKLSQFFKDNLK